MSAGRPTGRRHYVYYRVAESDLGAVTDAVIGAQAKLMGQFPGLHAELLRRDLTRDGHHTLMEVYDRPGGIDETIVAAIDRMAGACSQQIVGVRTIEFFVPI